MVGILRQHGGNVRVSAPLVTIFIQTTTLFSSRFVIQNYMVFSYL